MVIVGKYRLSYNNHSDSMYILTNTVSVPPIEMLEHNVIKAGRLHFSNMVLNLQAEGYTIIKEHVDDRYMDFGLSNLDNDVRLIYDDKNGTITMLSNPYEKISSLTTYINEEANSYEY